VGSDTGRRCTEVPALLGILDLLRIQNGRRGRHSVGADYNDASGDHGDD